MQNDWGGGGEKTPKRESQQEITRLYGQVHLLVLKRVTVTLRTHPLKQGAAALKRHLALKTTFFFFCSPKKKNRHFNLIATGYNFRNRGQKKKGEESWNARHTKLVASTSTTKRVVTSLLQLSPSPQPTQIWSASWLAPASPLPPSPSPPSPSRLTHASVKAKPPGPLPPR